MCGGTASTRRDHTEIPPEGLLREAAAADRRDPAGVVPSARDRPDGRACDARPHPPVPEHPAQGNRTKINYQLRGYPGMILLTLKDLWRLPSRYPCGCSGKRPPPGPLLSAQILGLYGRVYRTAS